ncbi:hypothetical protein Poli38472_012404 [Pythium oligandrum]|uniref:Uncharacterized protein n=1 Tax=Pythium oligandrum TaxID=41045 RepID=A0A8K1FR67_PYTOL|nr:hypothetical protein Poli38472_012404 [Pythium oligandrum]|eukprot:TMW67288.1 hypothetical protein Poli38472_012404 [Pythium oligandrum]
MRELSEHESGSNEPRKLQPALSVDIDLLISARTEQLSRQFTTRTESDAGSVLSYRDDIPPRLAVSLIPRKLLWYVLLTCFFLVIFTLVAYFGIVIDKFTEEIGSSSTRAEDQVQLYNTISGFILAFVEVCLGLFMANFLPAFMVYLHNSLWFLHRNVTYMKLSAFVRSLSMFFFPVLLMLLIGNSLRSLQAAQSTTGFETIMVVDDLRREQPMIEQIKASISTDENSSLSNRMMDNLNGDTLDLGILYNAVKRTSVPFSVKTNSSCSNKHGQKDVSLQLSLHNLDATNVVYGFTAQEWNSEALDEELESKASYSYDYESVMADPHAVDTPETIDMMRVYEMVAQSRVLLDKNLAETKNEYVPCTGYNPMDRRLQSASSDDGTESLPATEDPMLPYIKCGFSHDWLTGIGGYLADYKRLTVANLVNMTATGLAQTVDGFDKTSLTMELAHYELNPQISLEMVVIEGEVAVQETGFLVEMDDGTHIYSFDYFGGEICGSDNCLFIDSGPLASIPRQIVTMPYQANCSFTEEAIRYSSDLRGFFPIDCRPENNSMLVYSATSYISADEYGSNITQYDSNLAGLSAVTPYLINPKRHIRLVLGKLTWRTKELDKEFDAQCRRSKKCEGLAYKLPRTGRYIFAAEDSLPVHDLIASNVSLLAPLPLVQLNPVSVYISRLGAEVTPERLQWHDAPPDVFNKTQWKPLSNASCSVLVDSYIDHIEDNNFYFDLPYSVVYRAAFFHLFSNGSVTELNDTSFANLTKLWSTSTDALSNVKLKGDIVLRDIRVVLPSSPFKATMIGCGVLVLLALVVIAFPARRIEYFPYKITKAEKFIVMSNDNKYPDIVHNKVFLLPESGQALPFTDFHVEKIALRDRIFSEHELRFSHGSMRERRVQDQDQAVL